MQELIAKERKSTGLKLKTKIPTLDYILEGFREGNLITISAPTKSGKTTIAQTFTENFAEQKINCLWFSFEVPMSEFMDKYGDSVPLFFAPQQIMGNTTTWLEERIVEGIAKHDIKVAFIDHLHYIVNMNGRNNLSIEIGATMRELKRIALKYNIIIFLIAHTTKTKLVNEKDRVDLDDIRDSSFIAQESDIVIMLWRMKEDGKILDKAKLSVQAHRRTGKVGDITLIHFNGRFSELKNNE